MKKSFSYYILTLVLKLKGIKKTFNTSPVDYIKLREGDIKEPKGNFYKKRTITFNVLESVITKIQSKNKSDKLLLFIPGGAFISGPAKHHWDTLKKLHQKTNYNIWMCDYPKAPEHKISQISNNIDAIYKLALQNYLPDKIIIMGDSVGGTLSIALIQRLIKKNQKLPLKTVLISPVLDASMTNKAIDKINSKDIMLAKDGVVSAKKMCTETGFLEAKEISPINGDFVSFPETILCIGTQDIMYPDAQKMISKLEENTIKNKVILGEGMPHIWPLLPFLKEGNLALNEIITELNK